MKVRVVIFEAAEGGYWAMVPAYPGCVSEGDTPEEVKCNLAEALEGCLTVERPVEETGEQYQVLELDV